MRGVTRRRGGGEVVRAVAVISTDPSTHSLTHSVTVHRKREREGGRSGREERTATDRGMRNQ